MKSSRLRVAAAGRPLGTLSAWFAWTALATELNALWEVPQWALLPGLTFGLLRRGLEWER